MESRIENGARIRIESEARPKLRTGLVSKAKLQSAPRIKEIDNESGARIEIENRIAGMINSSRRVRQEQSVIPNRKNLDDPTVKILGKLNQIQRNKEKQSMKKLANREENFKVWINHLDYQQRAVIDKIILKNKSVFAKDKYDIGLVTNYEAHIDLMIEKYYNASILGVGQELKQPQESNEEKPVAYFLKKLSEVWKKKKAVYLECLAIKECVNYWQHLLIGRQFTVFSDPKPLENMNIKPRTDEELGDLTHYLSQYDFQIKYSRGRYNIEADCLSRNPKVNENLDKQLKVVNIIKLEDILKVQVENDKIQSRKDKRITRNNVYYKKLKKKEKIILSEKFSIQFIKNVHADLGHIGTKQLQKMTESDLVQDRRKALGNTIKSHNFNKKIYDKYRRHLDFKVGDTIFVDNGNKLNRKKLDELRIGPFMIIEKISNLIYKVNTNYRKSETNFFHISKLTLAHELEYHEEDVRTYAIYKLQQNWCIAPDHSRSGWWNGPNPCLFSSDFLCRGDFLGIPHKASHASSTPLCLVRLRTVKLNKRPANNIAEPVMFS
ncbi:Retrovirus-related Pol polyprotein from transposon 17.6 [Eumeta japonica]|uniref:Retrovirus-related Pol polyprotein from transposon 17.6 n=1 Tax=Eumeta variegata TaxID=151549 RepID=A0A4C1VMB7_EUMVA|nr:Retrovirus-related Pol polyprotein from transposon 17.6 [Eumeta japonica]